jgi:integrase
MGWPDAYPQLLHDIVLIALRLGLRKGEIIGVNRMQAGTYAKVGGLKIRNWDGPKKVLTFFRPKTNTETAIDLSEFPLMVELFDRYTAGRQDADGLLFRFKGQPIFDITKAYRHALQEARIVKLKKITGEAINFTFHDLRHTATADLLASGMPLEVVATVLGDNYATVYKVYARTLQKGQVKAGMGAYAKYLEAGRENEKGEVLKVVNGGKL